MEGGGVYLLILRRRRVVEGKEEERCKALLRGRWGFDHLKVISKYISFKGSKGRDLLKGRIFTIFIKPLKGFYKKGKNAFFKKRPKEEGLRG